MPRGTKYRPVGEVGINSTSAEVNRLLNKHAPDNVINSVYEHTAKSTHIGYDSWKRTGGKKSTATWDCSELSARTMHHMIDKMQESNINFKTDLKRLERAFPLHSTTISQRNELDKMDIPKVSGKSNVMKDLEVGMLIYMRYPTKKGQMGHVATVSRDPSSGDLVISESNGSSGVTHRSINNFFNSGVGARSSTNWVRYDPFYKDRPQLRAMEKEADKMLNVYVAANKAYHNEMNSPYQKVGAKKMSREAFLDNYIEKNFGDKDDEPKNAPSVTPVKYQNPEYRNGVSMPILRKAENSFETKPVLTLADSLKRLLNIDTERSSPAPVQHVAQVNMNDISRANSQHNGITHEQQEKLLAIQNNTKGISI